MKKSLKVLVFTYYWPPSGGPAVQRWLSLSSLLQEFNIDISIITVDEKEASYALIDESLNQLIPTNLSVYKTRTFEPINLYTKLIGGGKMPTAGFANEENPSFLQKIARWVRGNFFIPDPRIGWNRYAIAKANELISTTNFDFILTAGPPQSSHLIGLKLQAKHKIPWVADFHDAWTNIWYYNKLLKTNWAKKIDAKLEQKVLENAKLILTVGNQIKEDFASKLKSEHSDKLMLHSMGFDHALCQIKAKVPSNEFVISYTGTMANNYEPEKLFVAINNAQKIQTNTIIKVQLVGLIADDIKDKAKQILQNVQLTCLPYLPHKESLDIIFNSCLLLLLNPNTPQARMIIPGKIYEYMATRIPILNLANSNSETNRLIIENSAGRSFERNQIEDMTNWISSLIETWKLNPNEILNTNNNFMQYSRKIEAEKLANRLFSFSNV